MPDLVPIRVTSMPHPLLTRQEHHEFHPGMSLAEIIEAIQPDEELRRYGHCFVDGLYIPREDWGVTYPIWGAEIALRLVPGKDAFRMILMGFMAIAIGAATWGLAAPLATALFGYATGG